ncbi:MAG: hypothetical protein IRY99_19960 [Isosphaeraceae bacterium]|nr:hypothetical protein [Isosphaeraceae bacterium]
MNDRRGLRWIDRRAFLRRGGRGLAGAALLSAWGGGVSARFEAGRPQVAAVVTEFTYRSHAHVILENFLNPYLFNGRRTDPGVEVVSLYVDQFPARDMARAGGRGKSQSR